MADGSGSLIVVWGATPASRARLFGQLRDPKKRPCGPRAAALRDQLRAALEQEFASAGFTVCFSEQGPFFGHHLTNPGLYEPRQLRDAALVILLLPAGQPMGVNTWETTLALETDPATRQPFHGDKLLFVVPGEMYSYVSDLFFHDVADPCDFVATAPESEPELGPANSFAARWVYLALKDDFAQTQPSIGALPPGFPMACYDDSRSWSRQTREMKQLVREIVLLAKSRLPAGPAGIGHSA